MEIREKRTVVEEAGEKQKKIERIRWNSMFLLPLSPVWFYMCAHSCCSSPVVLTD